MHSAQNNGVGTNRGCLPNVRQVAVYRHHFNGLLLILFISADLKTNLVHKCPFHRGLFLGYFKLTCFLFDFYRVMLRRPR